MKSLIVVAALLGVFLTQALANDNIKINNEGNNGGNVYQNVNINNQDNIASVNSLNGWNSWDSICDYGRGYAATRLYNKKVCVVNRMNKSFPTLTQLSAIANDRKKAPSAQVTTYSINQRPIVHIEEFGQHIESLCRGLPAYVAQEMPNYGGGFESCKSSSIVTIFGINFCF